MSDYLGVATDYIYIPNSQWKKPVQNIFVVVATALNFIGPIVSAAVWYEAQVPMTVAIELIFMALGCMVFGAGTLSSFKAQENA